MWILQQNVLQTPLLYIDEVGFNVSMRRIYGRNLKGDKAKKTSTALRTRNISVIAAMSRTGLLFYQVLEGTCTAVAFSHFIDELAVRRDAAQMGNNTTLIMDNLSAHKTVLVRELMELRGFQCRYLPAYSPFHNPIESMFAQWKNLIRSLEPENEEELMHGIANFQLSQEQAYNYVSHAHNNAIRCIAGQDMLN